jgi:hypothetical protein
MFHLGLAAAATSAATAGTFIFEVAKGKSIDDAAKSAYDAFSFSVYVSSFGTVGKGKNS